MSLCKLTVLVRDNLNKDPILIQKCSSLCVLRDLFEILGVNATVGSRQLCCVYCSLERCAT